MARESLIFKVEVSISDAWKFEQQTEQLKDRVGRVVPEVGLQECGNQLRHPCCCGCLMRNQWLVRGDGRPEWSGSSCCKNLVRGDCRGRRLRGWRSKNEGGMAMMWSVVVAVGELVFDCLA